MLPSCALDSQALHAYFRAPGGPLSLGISLYLPSDSLNSFKDKKELFITQEEAEFKGWLGWG